MAVGIVQVGVGEHEVGKAVGLESSVEKRQGVVGGFEEGDAAFVADDEDLR
jgi:hypothetical protein